MKKYIVSLLLNIALLALPLTGIILVQQRATYIPLIDRMIVSHVTAIIGDATVVKSDGTRSPLKRDSVVYQGDTIETSPKSSVNIIFSDNSVFTLGENARASIDKYNYNAIKKKGTSFFSVQQGKFLYSSGMIGKDDPGNVNIQTPVGSISIRGTVVAGDIQGTGNQNHITLVDGAISFTNSGGTLDLNEKLGTAVISDNLSLPNDIRLMDPSEYSKHYQTLASALEAAGKSEDHIIKQMQDLMLDVKKNQQLLNQSAIEIESDSYAGSEKEWTQEDQEKYQKMMIEVTKKQEMLEEQARKVMEHFSNTPPAPAPTPTAPVVKP